MIIENVRVKSCKLDGSGKRHQLVFAIDDKKERKALIKMIDADWDENGTKKKPDNLAYFKSESNDEYPDDQDTGTKIFIATKALVNKQDKELTVPVFKKNGNAYEELPNIGAGTIINLSTDTYTYDNESCGTKLNLNKVQVMDLVEYSGDTFENKGDDKFDDKPKKKKKGKKSKK